MPWSEAVIEQFSIVDRFTTEESDWYGPFNTLLFELFPPSEHYQITPQYKHVKGSQEFTVHYIIHKRRVPIFFVEIKPYGSLVNFSARGLADAQMRDRFREFTSDSIPTPKLIGISSFGSQFCPALIAADAHLLNDIAPQDRWAFDILNDEGEAKLREVVAAVKAMAANL
ncbi:hypothetical protein BS47DRAFT_1489623 [Hydnum rufescens UP504]|uniref:Uncharacterized protein n=1 Tax=Hydnum rufescens UP504 TaxID=1448309 RepID=A0A9P6DPR7_9AGAM|nr:hypothetical protein BS47DRAFT_1489623 [Hydnum rufescens UP504]